MAFMTFVAGQTLTAAQVNTYLAKQAVIVCTSTTRPSSPPEGMTIYETDTDKLLVYTTATTGWQPPWNISWGAVGVSAAGTNVAVSTTATTVLTAASVPIVANRRVRVTANVGLLCGSTGLHVHQIKMGGTVVATSTVSHVAGSITYSTTPISAITSAATGTYAFTVVTTLAAGTGTVDGSSTTDFLVVEDLGPSGAPL